MASLEPARTCPSILSLRGTAIAQFVSCDFKVTPVVATDGMAEVWSGGPGSLNYNSPTEADPCYKLSVKEAISCNYGFFNAFLPHAKILKTY